MNADHPTFTTHQQERPSQSTQLERTEPQSRWVHCRSLKMGSESKEKLGFLRVPDLSNPRTKTVRNLENADAQIADTVSDALGGYSKRLDEGFNSDNEATRTQIALLGSARLKKALAESPDQQTLAGAVGKVLSARLKIIGERQKTLETAIKQAQVNLKTRAAGYTLFGMQLLANACIGRPLRRVEAAESSMLGPICASIEAGHNLLCCNNLLG